MTQAPAQSAIKRKHKAMWAFGNHDAVATEVVGGLGPVIVEAAGVGAGQRVLDVAAGSGKASIPAAVADQLTRPVVKERVTSRHSAGWGAVRPLA